nr:MAG: hypothetical protein BECKDK2373C_GA0170839_10052 [Candidatus Kentron sp. DK]
MGGWGCPNEVDGACLHVPGKKCDPGMKGCVLFGRFVFSNPAKNRPGGPARDRKKAEAGRAREGNQRKNHAPDRSPDPHHQTKRS